MNILFISLGCDKNLVDSEVMLGILAKGYGHQMVDDETMADVIIINTCCFIHDAKEESIQNILEMADLKKTGRLKALDRNRLSCTEISKKRSFMKSRRLMRFSERLLMKRSHT